MALKDRVQIILGRHSGRGDVDVFHEERLQQDLTRFSEAPGPIEKLIERARVRFEKAGERAILSHWAELYQAGESVIAAKVAMERQKSEYLRLATDHEAKAAEQAATRAKLQADNEEQELRRDKAAYQRQHLERYVDGAGPDGFSEDQAKLRQACERRQLDARWELHESLRPLQSLIELQHWRRQQRDQILKDRSLSPEEQNEDLQFVDALFQQKHAELKVETRIFEEQ